MIKLDDASDLIQRTQAGKHQLYGVSIAADLNGGEITIPVHVFRGSETGPTLSLFSGVHGNDWGTVEIMRRISHRVQPEELRGNLVMVPVANPVALGAQTRNTPDESDNSDLNRAFPGGDGTFTSRLAEQVVKILKSSNYFIDYHSNGWITSYHSVSTLEGDSTNESVARVDSMAKAYGCKLLHPKAPDPKTLSGFAQSKLGLAGFTVHIGGMGFADSVEDSWMETNVNGVHGVMRSIGILSGAPNLLNEYWVHKRRWRVFPRESGFLRVLVGPERLLGPVSEGELLAELYSPYSLTLLQELRAPASGYLGYLSRTSMVRPGATAFGVVDVDVVKAS